MCEKQKELAKVINGYFGADAAYLDIDVFTLARRIMEAGWEKPVRCKDCKQLEITGCYGECKRGYMGIVKPWDFCSYGERKYKQ